MDHVADSPLLAALRLEAGLQVWRGLPVEYYDEQVEILFDGWLGADGRIELARERYSAGSRFYVPGPTAEAAQARANSMAETMRSRGREVQLSEPFERPDRVVPLRLRGGSGDASRFNNLMIREAAKVAIEFIGKVQSPEVALLPNLDQIRACARSGYPLTGARVGCSAREVWLPRLGLVMRTDEYAPSDDEVAALVPNIQPPGAVRVPPLRHELSMAHGREGPYFCLVLFGHFGMVLPLPAGVPFPRGLLYYKDLERARTGTGRI